LDLLEFFADKPIKLNIGEKELFTMINNKQLIILESLIYMQVIISVDSKYTN